MRSSIYLTSLLEPILDELEYTFPQGTTIEPPKDKHFGDLACNIAMVLAKEARKNPRELATLFAEKLQQNSPFIAEATIAGPGFLNITFVPEFWQKSIALIDEQKTNFGASTLGRNAPIQVEYVSANPTGPLHIGHGRGAAFGDSLVRILQFAGYNVQAEYYVNDAGVQMQTLGRSIYYRALEHAGKSTISYPDDCYKGSYIKDIAIDISSKSPDVTTCEAGQAIATCQKFGLKAILQGIKKDLADFNVRHDNWFSEQSLLDDGSVDNALQTLQDAGHIFEKDGALWFKSTAFGDDKDRVLRKSDGSLTYFASDIAYHANKINRGFTWLIDVWGADHHGYILRMQAAVQALGRTKETFHACLIQLVNLIKEGEQVAMSTRAGKFETLAQVIEEVGADAARFIFLSRKNDSKLDFDMDLLKQRTMDNPVYYVQYAHARICTLLQRATERELPPPNVADTALLTEVEELELLKMLDRFSLIVKDAATNLAPHFISYYLMELAGAVHKYYAIHSVFNADSQNITLARMRLLRAAGQVIENGLSLLGVSAPRSM